jgi:hypothetical protein
MKEFSNPRELIGQIGLDLEARSGRIGKSFRVNIRKELQKFCDEKDATISITQTYEGSYITLSIADGITKEKSDLLKREFKDLMGRLGASSTGVCSGPAPGVLITFLSQSTA